jgi:general secretion pathway protein I
MTRISAWNKGGYAVWSQLVTLKYRLSPAGHNGFTLLEVMVAISMLAIALTTLFGSQSQSVSLAATTKFNIQGPLLAQLKLAEFTASTDRPASDSGDFGDEFPGFQWQLETAAAHWEGAATLDGSTDANNATNLGKAVNTLQLITVTVSWGEDTYSYELQGYLPTNSAP